MNYIFLFLILGGLLIGCGKDNPNNSTTIPVVGSWEVSRNNTPLEVNHFYSNGIGYRDCIRTCLEGDFRWDCSGATESHLPRFSVVFLESGRAELYEIDIATDSLFVAFWLDPNGERGAYRATYRRISDNQSN